MSQTLSHQAGRPDSSAPAPAKNLPNFFRRLANNRLAMAIVIFVIAFALRAGHNLSLEHRVWYFEDAQNYLRSGASIYRMVRESKTPSEFIENVKKDAKSYSGMYEAFNSDKLVDRLVTDGAVFPIYLAGVERVAGLDFKNPQYENIALKTSIAYSLLDSATCVLVYLLGILLFGFAPGALAGLLYAIYPPAIVNTQWCMSESFCSFMLVSTVYCIAHYSLLPPQAVARKTIVGVFTGIVTSLTLLARSAFPLFIPFLALSAILGTRDRKSLLSPVPLIVMAMTIALTLAPWYLYTQTALGQARLTTNRLPAFNVLSGNLASIDGYTPFPSTIPFPEGMKEAIEMIVAEAGEKPGELILLEMKKLARLWSSVWNDCKYPVCGIDVAAQNVFHQLMLFLALCWGFIVCARGKRRLTDGELLGTWLTFTAIATHFTYLAFIALSRYAFTAMPFVILPASAAVVAWFHTGEPVRKKLMIVVASFIVAAAITNQFRSFSQLMCALVSETWWINFAPLLTALIAIAAYAGVWLIAVRTIYRFTNPSNTAPAATPLNTPIARSVVSESGDSTNLPSVAAETAPKSDSESEQAKVTAENSGTEETVSAAADKPSPALAISSQEIAEYPSRLAITVLAAASLAFTSCGIIGSIVGSRGWSEWSCPLTDQQAHQTIQLPAVGEIAKVGYVLIDALDEEPLPSLEVELNDHLLSTDAIPVQMIQKDNESIVKSLTMQANSMDMDCRTIRHWYAVPFSTDLLRLGEQNTIAVRNKSKTHPVTIYGDFAPTTPEANDGLQVLPSVNSLSWNYAVEGSDYHSPMEPRLLESIKINGKTTESSLASKIRSYEAYKDLSPSFGTQWGRYRLRLLLHPLSAQQIAKQSQISKQTLSSEDKNVKPDSNSTDSTPGTSEPAVIETIFAQTPGEERTVHGGNPTTFYLTKTPVAVAEDLVAKHPIRFTCELKAEKRPVNAFINLVFKTGIGDVWTPEWQPESIPVESDHWKKLTIVDAFPKKLLEHNGVFVQPIITPFSSDLLFTHRKKAGKQIVLIRNAKLEVMSTDIPERSNLFNWKVY